MNEHRDLLERVGERFAFPDQAFERLARRRDRKHRNQRIAAGVVAVAVLVAPIWVVASGELAERRVTPGGSGPVVAPEYPGLIGIVGLPPEDAIPSSPSEGELVVGAVFGHSGGDPGRFDLNVYEDGRVIWQKLGATGLIEQRLTSEGVERIRSEVLSLGLFDGDLHLVGGYLPYFGAIEVSDGDRLVQVSWGDIGPRTGPDTPATPEQADAIKELGARLEDLASWLPASDWEDQELRPYVASRYSVCYEATRQGAGVDRVLSSLPPPVEAMLRPLDRTHGEYGGDSGFGGGPAVDYWCSAVTTEQARGLAGHLDAAGATSNGGDIFGVVYRTSDREPVQTLINFEPLLPDELRDENAELRQP